MSPQTTTQLPIPSYFDARRVGEVWRVPYQERANQVTDWAYQHSISPAAERRCFAIASPATVKHSTKLRAIIP
jgi:hypothetical protein